MPLCHHADVAGKRRSGWGRYPDRWKFCDHVEWLTLAADDAGSLHVETVAATGTARVPEKYAAMSSPAPVRVGLRRCRGGLAASATNLKHLVGLVALCVVKESDDLGC